ncbi:MULTISPECIES: hypothetical protein [Pseudomonas]|uniref:hypothetical protein n=1 Tax=Pseudomonas TaxID=286 RepID=UPI0006D412C6|nr:MULTISPECIES: hypothetical protein [Pseudomonas]MDG9891220.1 hypothetical protein [Pseudomonas juntendi]
MLSHLHGEVLHRVGALKGDAERVAKALGQIDNIDPHAVERGMIALRRALAQLENAVTRNEVD